MSARKNVLGTDLCRGPRESSADRPTRDACDEAPAAVAEQCGEHTGDQDGQRIKVTEEALEAACALALEHLSAPDVLSLLNKYSTPVEAIGHITCLHDSFFICATSQGDVFVPKHLVPTAVEHFALCEGTSWILTMLPSLRRRTQWRAVTVAHNDEGWQSAGRVRKAPRSARLPWERCDKPHARTFAAPREKPVRSASGRCA